MILPKIIVITGVDGSGKSTQARLLVDYLKQKGPSVNLVQQFASESIFGKIILEKLGSKLIKLERETATKSLFNSENLEYKSPVKKLLRFLAEIRIILTGLYHVWIKIWKNRKKSILVFDRYFYDDILKIKWMYGLHDQAERKLTNMVPKPTILFYLDIPAETAWKREKDGNTTLEQHITKKQIYDKWFGNASKTYKNFYRVSTDKEKYQSHSEIINLIKKMKASKRPNQLKVTFIGQASLDDTHGGAIRLKSMIKLLNDMSIQVDLITYSFYSEKFGVINKKVNPLFRSITIYTPNNLPRFLKSLFVLPVFLYAWKFTKSCNLIFANFRCIISSVPAIILGDLYNKPVILDYLDVDPDIPELLYEYVAKKSDAVMAITHRLINKVKSYGCKNAFYVPNFVDTNIFRMDYKARKEIREILGIKKDEIAIGYAGSFWYVEGVSILLKAFKNMIKKYPKIKLAIIGAVRWNEDENIPKLVNDMNLNDNVILIPPQPHEKVPKFLSAFDVLCCPKIYHEVNIKIIPIKFIEYLSMGIPTVTSAVGEIPDIVEDGVDCLLVTPSDMKDLEKKLEWVILNLEQAKKIGRNGRRKVVERYSDKAIKNTIIEIVTNVLNKRRKEKGL